MAFSRRHPHPDDVDTDDEQDANIDPNLRLRTVRTAHSTIAESVLVEQRATRRKSRRFFKRKPSKKQLAAAPPPEPPQPAAPAAPSTHVPGRRRNIYVNQPLEPDELDQHGEPEVRYVRNKVRTSSASIRSFYYECVLNEK